MLQQHDCPRQEGRLHRAFRPLSPSPSWGTSCLADLSQCCLKTALVGSLGSSELVAIKDIVRVTQDEASRGHDDAFGEGPSTGVCIKCFEGGCYVDMSNG